MQLIFDLILHICWKLLRAKSLFCSKRFSLINAILFRLPTSIQPKSYFIYLHPNLTSQLYSGNVSINFTVRRTTKVIILHSRGHELTSTLLYDLQTVNGVAQIPKQIMHCDMYETVSFDFDFDLKEGEQYQLVVYFKGNLTFSLGGFYLSSYKKKDGSEKVIGTTQFESIDARAAFPCFDEPAFKVRMCIKLLVIVVSTHPFLGMEGMVEDCEAPEAGQFS